ncbi:MAG: GIY-YIG nuclease family protein [Chitinophagaceae bacterium]|nr:GIY-YIG nuclease family protein [Chitinophagaceae bacterium]
MAYDIDFAEEAIIGSHIKKFLLYPVFWADAQNQIGINTQWKKVMFSSANKKNVPNKKGVYAFVLKPVYHNFFETNYLFYVGKTNRTLRLRFQEYLDEKAGKGKPRKKIHKMLNMYDGFLEFYYAEIGRKNQVDKVEEQLLNTFVPHVNTSIPKARIKHELKYIYEQN